MGDIVPGLFQDAMTAYRRAIRWQVIAVLALTVMHVAIVAPFGALRSRQVELEGRLAAARPRAEALAAARSAAEGFDAVARGLRGAVEEEHGRLVEDFGELNRIVARLRALGPDEAAGPAGEAVASGFGASVLPSPVLQLPPAPAPPADLPAPPVAQRPPVLPHPPGPLQSPVQWAPQAPVSLPTIEPALRRRLAQASDDRELRAALRGYIEANLVAPRFAALNAQVLPDFRDRLEASRRVLDAELGAAASAGIDDPRLEALRRRAADAGDIARRLRLAPPDDPEWWATVGGKGQALLLPIERLTASPPASASMQGGPAQLVIGDLMALEELATIAAGGVREAATLAERTKAGIAALEERFDNLQAQLSGMLGLSGTNPFRLDWVAYWFPLLLGVVAGATILWQANALAELGLTARLLAEREETAGQAIVAGAVAPPAGSGSLPFNAVRFCLLALWLGTATVTASRLPDASPRLAVAAALLGAAAIAGASWLLEHARRKLAPARPA